MTRGGKVVGNRDTSSSGEPRVPVVGDMRPSLLYAPSRYQPSREEVRLGVRAQNSGPPS
jgi:hypothetical protein